MLLSKIVRVSLTLTPPHFTNWNPLQSKKECLGCSCCIRVRLVILMSNVVVEVLIAESLWRCRFVADSSPIRFRFVADLLRIRCRFVADLFVDSLQIR